MKRGLVNHAPMFPVVSSYTDLPNIPGSPNSTSDLEVGDQCVSSDDGTNYVCTNAVVGNATFEAQAVPKRYRIGNQLAGDTHATCHYLDPGDGSAITTVLSLIGSLPYTKIEIELAPGNYTIPNGVTFTIPSGVAIIGSGVDNTVIVTPSGNVSTQPWRTFVLAGTRCGIKNIKFRSTGLTDTAATGSGTGVVEITGTDCYAHNLTWEISGSFTLTTYPWVALVAYLRTDVAGCDVNGLRVLASSAEVTWSGATSITLGAFMYPQTPTIDWDGISDYPQVRNVYMRSTYDGWVNVGQYAVYSRCTKIDIDDVRAAGCYSAVSVYQVGAASTHGPNISRVRARPIGAHDSVGAEVYMAGTTDIEGISIVDVRYSWAAAGVTHGAAYVHAKNTYANTIRNVIISRVQAKMEGTNVSAQTYVSLQSRAAGTTITNAVIDNVQLPDTNSQITLFGTVGTISKCRVVNSRAYDFLIQAVANTNIVAVNHVANPAGVTNSGTATSLGNNQIG